MLFEVTHTTRYIYQSPVTHCLNEVRLMPRPLPTQDVQKFSMKVDPEAAFMHERKDYYGNAVTAFEVFDKHERLETTAESTVEVRGEPLESLDSVPWEEARDLIAAPPDPASIEAAEFTYSSPFVPYVLTISDYARGVFEPGRPLVEAARALTKKIHDDFKYHPKSTSIDIPLAEVMRNRRGVCQDFAHVMIGALRSLRLAARYVSGYVRPGPKVQGAQASHAWVSVFVPGKGWISFDPTNDLIVSDSHITLAWGRDYGDVTPVKGITLGGAGQTVEVEVYVRSVDKPA